MAGSFSDFLENELLDHVFGNAAYTAPATLYLALFTGAPNDAGGGTEVGGVGYVRQPVTNNATNFPAAAGGSKSNGTVQDFSPAGSDWGEIVAGGIFDTSPGGNLLAWSWLKDNPEVSAPGTALASSDVFTSFAHGFSTNDRAVLTANNGGTLPAGVSALTAYYVIGAATDTFQLSLTLGGAAINLTTDGEFTAYRIKPVTINNGDTFRFPVGSIDLTLD